MSSAQRLYESSLLQYWYHLKAKFYFEITIKIIVNGFYTGGQGIYDFYASITDGYNDIYLKDMQSLFVFMICSLCVSVIGLICELCYHHAYIFFYVFPITLFLSKYRH